MADAGVAQVDTNRLLIFGGLNSKFDEKTDAYYLDVAFGDNTSFVVKKAPPMPVGIRSKQAGHQPQLDIFTYIFEEYNDLLRFDKDSEKWTYIEV